MTNDEIKSLIKRRRGQMLVHSFLYYKMDNPIISDDLWQQWADELTQLQAKYPRLCKLDYYDKEFADFDGSTGMHLPQDIIVEGKAMQVLRSYEMMTKKDPK